MTLRLSIDWPDARPFLGRDGRPIRILAASDEPDPALEDPRNRAAVGPIDLVVGCGDLGPDRLAFLGDAFSSPLVYVRGNHDRGGPWPAPAGLPEAAAGFDTRTLPGLALLALPWPDAGQARALRDEGAAWRQAVRLAGRRLLRPPASCLVFSHVPARGAGDMPEDAYHRGFAAYRFLLDRIRPPLWLHGHTALAAQRERVVRYGPTRLVNVTGSVLVELCPPALAGAVAPPAGADPGR